MNFFLNCNPPKTTHQANLQPLRNRRTGALFIGKRSSSKGKALQKEFRALLLPHKPKTPLSGPVSLQVAYLYAWNKSEPKKNRTSGWMWKATRPDADNLPKIFVDVMTDLGFWEDDGQIAQFLFQKAYVTNPGIRVKLTPLTAMEAPRWYEV
ncbi:MAG: RusA family crossover junction endodeoxyribonuclease [Limisphaerales bacterium]